MAQIAIKQHFVSHNLLCLNTLQEAKGVWRMCLAKNSNKLNRLKYN